MTRLAGAKAPAFLCFVAKHLVKGCLKRQGNLERNLEAGRVLALLDRNNGLSRYSDAIGKLLLGHFIAGETQLSNIVCDSSWHLRPPAGSR